MVYKIQLAEKAERELSRLNKKEMTKIVDKLDEYEALSNPLVKAQRLKSTKVPLYRFRIGNYRAIFRKDQKTGLLVILVVIKIAHRKEVYKKLT